MIFHKKFCSFLKCFRKMLSERFVVCLLLIEVFVIILILGITRGEDLAVALGTISMALAIVYIELIKPWLQKPKIKIEFENRAPFCRDCLTGVKDPAGTGEDQVGYFIRLRIRNIGGLLARNLRGKLVKVIDKDGEIHMEFDPLFLHWVSNTRKGMNEFDPYIKWIDPIDLNIEEWEYLDVFSTKTHEKKGLIHIGTKEEDRGCRMKFEISEGLKAFKITVYGENIEPVTETYKLKWDGENYNEIRMCRINQKEANNT